MRKESKILVTIVILLGMLFLSNQVKADDIINNNVPVVTPNTITNNAIGNENTNTGNTNTAVNNVSSNSIVSPTTNNTATNKTNSSTYNTTDLPKTGAEDYTVVFIIMGVCGIAAIYAYRKMNDYNKIK